MIWMLIKLTKNDEELDIVLLTLRFAFQFIRLFLFVFKTKRSLKLRKAIEEIDISTVSLEKTLGSETQNKAQGELEESISGCGEAEEHAGEEEGVKECVNLELADLSTLGTSGEVEDEEEDDGEEGVENGFDVSALRRQASLIA